MNLDNRGAGAPPTAMVFWIIWFSLFSGMFMILQFAGGGWPSGDNTEAYLSNPMFWIPIGMFAVSQVVRWFVLPMLKTPQAMLPPAIIGMAMAEGTMILALFLLPKGMVEGKQILIILGFLGVLSFAPVYLMKRDGGSKDYTDIGRE
ncbi:hypothetical protein [Haloferula sp.]|uniref:hypothetical protein n=1 Tax=Haloferula sp. TaxID=2497595 RepID=UPI0032A1129F